MQRANSRLRVLGTCFVLLVMLGGASFSFASKVPFAQSSARQGFLAGAPTGDGTASASTNSSSSSTESEDSNSTSSSSTSENETQSGATTTASENETQSSSFLSQTENENQTSSTQSESEGENSTGVTTSVSESETESANQTGTVTTGTESEQNDTQSVSSSESETENENSTTTVSTNETESENASSLALIPANLTSVPVPPGYQVGNGTVEVEGGNGEMAVHVEMDGMNPSTNFSLTLVVNGSDVNVGRFISDSEGQAEFEASVNFTAGRYAVGAFVNDTSTLSSPFTVLESSPSTIPVVVSPGGEGGSGVSTESVTAVSIGESDFQSLQNAISSSEIPVVVQVSDSGVDFSVIDHSFTVFVGTISGNGIQISISTTGASTPRVILVNLNSQQFANLNSGTLLVTFDGTKVQQATSLSQVLGVKATDLPSFILITVSGQHELLVSVPHFSTHLIKVFPVALQPVATFLAVNGPILLLSMTAITVAFAAVYARRTRVYA